MGTALPALLRARRSIGRSLLLGLATAMAVLLAFPLIASADSGWFPPTGWWSSAYGASWRAGSDGSQRTVQDFSYAGYHMGEAEIPTSPPGPVVDVTQAPYSADPTGRTDSTWGIQRALDHVGQSGGGVVYLPKGTYSVSLSGSARASLNMRYSNVVLRGAGRELTFVRNTSTYMRNKAVLYIGPSSRSMWAAIPKGEPNLAETAPERSREVTVTNPESFHVGEWVVLRSEATTAWVAERGNPRGWGAPTMDATTFLRRIVAIDGPRLTVDIPLRQSLLMRDRGDQPNVYAAPPLLSEVGVEDLSIGMVANPKTGWSDADYDKPGTANYDVYRAYTIHMNAVVNGWMQRVNSYATTRTRPDVHLLSDGLLLDYDRSVTVRDVDLRYPQSRGSDENGYLFCIRGSDNLLERCTAVGARHSFTFSYWWATGNVLRDCASIRPVYAVDFHARYSAANLIDGMRLDRDRIDATFRTSTGSLYGAIPGQTTNDSVFWNTFGLAYAARSWTFPTALVHSVQWGWGAAIGSSGPAARMVTDPASEPASSRDRSQDLAQGEGAGGTLLPRSLYADQLARRLQGEAATQTAFGVVLPAVADAFVTAAYPTHSYGARTDIRARDRGGDRHEVTYVRFNVRGLQRVLRARLVIDGRVADTTPGSSKLQAYAVGVDGWSETALTWRNRPAVIRALGTATVPQTQEPTAVAFDVTSFLRDRQWVGDKAVSFAIVAPSGSRRVVASSRETSSGPRLEIETAEDTTLAVTAARGTSAGASATVDSNRATAYSSSAYGTRITYDLGTPRIVSAVGVAFVLGDRRAGLAEVEASEDGRTFVPLRDVVNVGETAAMQLFPLDAPVRARYVRLIGYGNGDRCSPLWNSWSEVELFGRAVEESTTP